MNAVVARWIVATILMFAVSAAESACPAYPGETLHAWRRTWHGPNALETPLRGYYVPRLAGRCDRQFCSYFEASFPPQAAVGFEPLRFERLGQIPNDLDLGGDLPAAVPSR